MGRLFEKQALGSAPVVRLCKDRKLCITTQEKRKKNLYNYLKHKTLFCSVKNYM